MKVMIVDDDPLVSGALKVILEQDDAKKESIEVICTCSNGRDAIAKYDELIPDVVLMDIRMDKMNGLDAATAIISKHSQARILFLTTFLDDEYINRALKIGSRGCILKQDCATLPSAVRAIYGEQIVFGGKIVEKLPDLINRQESFNYKDFDITSKEIQLIELVADGLSNKEIAEKMFLGEGTVRNMMSTVLNKLGLRDRTQLACFYYQKIKP